MFHKLTSFKVYMTEKGPVDVIVTELAEGDFIVEVPSTRISPVLGNLEIVNEWIKENINLNVRFIKP